jgi:hypothetical protein
MNKAKMNSHEKFYYDAYKKDKKAFSNWMASNIKNGIRIADINDCRDAWNCAIKAAILVVNNSNSIDVIDDLKKLQDIEE